MIFKTSQQFLSKVSVGDTFWMVRENMGKGLVSIKGPYILVEIVDSNDPGDSTPTKKVFFTDSKVRRHEWYIESLFTDRCVTTTSQEDAQRYYDIEKPRELTSRRLKRKLVEEQEYLKEQEEVSKYYRKKEEDDARRERFYE